jgi:hypothetical protein
MLKTSQIEAMAKQLSKQSWRLAMWETKEGWGWQWETPSRFGMFELEPNQTNIADKKGAFVMAIMQRRE